MRRAFSIRHACLAAAALVVAAPPAMAQGTEAQRQACAPDAIRLCQDTIPDVAGTTACMRAHEAELSPACHAAFAEATGEPRAAPSRAAETPEAAPMPRRPHRVARAVEPETDDLEPAPPPRRHVAGAPRSAYALQHHRSARHEDPELRDARRTLGRLCAARTLGADTCAFTAQMMQLAQ